MPISLFDFKSITMRTRVKPYLGQNDPKKFHYVAQNSHHAVGREPTTKSAKTTDRARRAQLRAVQNRNNAAQPPHSVNATRAADPRERPQTERGSAGSEVENRERRAQLRDSVQRDPGARLAARAQRDRRATGGEVEGGETGAELAHSVDRTGRPEAR